MRRDTIYFYVIIPFLWEFRNLKNLIRSIKRSKSFRYVKKIIIVTPNKSIKKFIKNSGKIKLILENHRKGKSIAINTALRLVEKNSWILLINSDVTLRKDFLDYLMRSLKNQDLDNVGGIVCRVMPSKKGKKYWLSKVIWDLHHISSLFNPKVSEIFMFKKFFDAIPPLVNDDVAIEYLIKKSGRKIVYEPKCYGFTESPNTLKYFFNQRKRIFFGHLEAYLKLKYLPGTVDFKNLIRVLKIYLRKRSIKEWLIFILVVFIEILARIAALIDFLLGRKRKNIIWWKEFY